MINAVILDKGTVLRFVRRIRRGISRECRQYLTRYVTRYFGYVACLIGAMSCVTGYEVGIGTDIGDGQATMHAAMRLFLFTSGGLLLVAFTTYPRRPVRRFTALQRRVGPRQSKTKRWFSTALLLSVVVGCGWYGFDQGVLHTENIQSILGQSIEAKAVVSGVYPTKPHVHPGSHTRSHYNPGVLVQFQVNQIDYRSQTRPCSLQVIWLPSGRSQTATSSRLRQGDEVDLMGQISKSKNSLQWFGYVTQMPATSNWVKDVLSQVHRAAILTFPNQQSLVSLLESIVFGQTTDGTPIDKSLKQAFLRSGLLHVLAASGANLLVLETGLSTLLRPVWRAMRLPGWTWMVWMLMMLWGFTCLCGLSSSIVRAAFMATYRHVGASIGRPPSLRSAFVFTVLVMSMVFPSTFLQQGTFMSLIATAAVGLAVQNLKRKAKHGPQQGHRTPHRFLIRLASKWIVGCRDVIITSMWVEVLLFPFLLYQYGQWTPYSVLSNLVAEPILLILLPLTSFWFVANWLFQTWLHWFPFQLSLHWLGILSLALVSGLKTWVLLISSWPGSLIQWTPISVWWMVGMYAFEVGTYGLWRRWKARGT